jgi:prepilin-type N-terminal cleavage/methylation domain-containing protein
VTSAQRRGFSIIEMLIVMIVIGIIASFVAPRVNLARYQVESGMLGVGTTLIAAQRLSVLRGYDVIIGFDVPNASIRVHEDSNANGLIDAGERVRRIPLGEHVVFGRGGAPAFDIGSGPVTFTDIHDGLPCLVFHRNGSANQAQGFYLTSERESRYGGHPEDARLVVIDRATGRVNWYRYGPPSWRRGF